MTDRLHKTSGTIVISSVSMSVTLILYMSIKQFYYCYYFTKTHRKTVKHKHILRNSTTLAMWNILRIIRGGISPC